MATQYTLPDLGDSVKSGTLAKVLVAVGDQIEMDQPVLELETDKAVMEVPSTVTGKVLEILVKAGDKLSVGQPVFAIEAIAASAEPAQPEAPAPPEPDKKEPATGAAPRPVVAPEAANGHSANGHAANGSAPSNGSGPGQARQAGATAPTLATGSINNPIPAPPSVRRLARELGIDLNRVHGTGPGGRISFSDVRTSLQGAQACAAVGGGAAPPLPDFSQWGQVERQPLSNVRQATVHQMALSWSQVTRVTQFDKADITELETLRKKFAAKAEAGGGKLTVTAIALKVAAAALKVFPQFNASLDVGASELVLKHYCNIGVAVDTPRGLLVPVIRDVPSKNIVQLAAELAQAAARARDRKLGLAEMQGGCFTITNLGGIGGTNFTPIVNLPEVAILGLSRGAIEPVWNGSAFEPRTMLPLALSYDHRVIDGADAARFLRWIAEALEQPFLLALEG